MHVASRGPGPLLRHLRGAVITAITLRQAHRFQTHGAVRISDVVGRAGGVGPTRGPRNPELGPHEAPRSPPSAKQVFRDRTTRQETRQTRAGRLNAPPRPSLQHSTRPPAGGREVAAGHARASRPSSWRHKCGVSIRFACSGAKREWSRVGPLTRTGKRGRRPGAARPLPRSSPPDAAPRRPAPPRRT
jgi:hypothetical protein